MKFCCTYDGPRLTKKEANTILNFMRSIIEQYGYVTYGDYRDLLGRRTIHNSDNDIGWTSLVNADVVWDWRRMCFGIALPKPTPLDTGIQITNNDFEEES